MPKTTMTGAAKTKSILFIDDSLPEYDKAAGARSSYMYIKLLQSMGYRITFYAVDLVRRNPYASYLENLGIKVIAGELYRTWWRLWFKLNAKKFDVVFFNRPEITFAKLKYFNNKKIRKIYQCHDLHHVRIYRQYELAKDESLLKESIRLEAIEREVYDKIDIALTFSENEKKIIEKKFGHPKAVVVPLYFYNVGIKPNYDFESRRDILYVGGFGHPPNVDAIQWFLREVMPQIRQQTSNIKLLVAGSNPPPEILALDGENVKILGYVDDQQLTNYYQSVRLVVVPLRYGAGVKGKVIEAIYNCVPLVSTSIGLEGIAEIDTIVRPADTADAFSASVLELYRDERTLALMSQALRRYATEHLSVDSAREIMREVIESDEEVLT